MELKYTHPIKLRDETKPYAWPNATTLKGWKRSLAEFLNLIEKRARERNLDLGTIGNEARKSSRNSLKNTIHHLTDAFRTHHDEPKPEVGKPVPLGKPIKPKRQAKSWTKRSEEQENNRADAMKTTADDCAFALYLIMHPKLL